MIIRHQHQQFCENVIVDLKFCEALRFLPLTGNRLGHQLILRVGQLQRADGRLQAPRPVHQGLRVQAGLPALAAGR